MKRIGKLDVDQRSPSLAVWPGPQMRDYTVRASGQRERRVLSLEGGREGGREREKNNDGVSGPVRTMAGRH